MLSACGVIERPTAETRFNGTNHFGFPGGILTPSASSQQDAPNLSGHYLHAPDHRRAVVAWHPTEWAHIAIRRDHALDAPIYKYSGGFDAQIRLTPEEEWQPALAVGARSLIGYGEEGTEYIVASKKIGPAQISLGAGTGQLSQFGSINHPLKSLGGRFENSAQRGHNDYGPDVWGGGDEIGFFGNLRLDLPLPNVAFVGEFGGDDENHGRIGVDWQPLPHINLSVSADQDHTVMARVSARMDPIWRKRPRQDRAAITPITARPSEGRLSRLEIMGLDHPPQSSDLPDQDINDHTILLTQSGVPVSGVVIPGHKPTPPSASGASGAPAATSAEENWYQIATQPRNQPLPTDTDTDTATMRFEIMPTWIIDPYEPRNRALNRQYLDLALEAAPGGGTRFGTTLRINGWDTVDELRRNRRPTPLPVHSDLVNYLDQTIWLERLYVGQFIHPLPNFYGVGYGGFLEETHAGFGGDLLYRPENQKWDLQGSVALAQKRDPDDMFRLLPLPTSHIWDLSVGYEVNDQTFATLGVGRYLAGDSGPQFNLTNIMEDGTRIEGWARWGNPHDMFWLAENYEADFGLRLSVPFALSNTTRIRPKVHIEPLGRDAIQMLDKPLNLRDMTRPARIAPP